MVSCPGSFSDSDNSYYLWNKTGDAVFNAVYSESGIEKKIEFKLMVRTREEIDKLVPLQLTLSKTTDFVQIGGVYDLSKIIVTAHYGDGSTNTVTPVWSIISGDGAVNQNMYTAPQNNVMVKLLCKYVEYGRSVSSEIEINVCNLENVINNQTQEVNVIESQKKIISTAGGSITLKNGTTLEIPQNALVDSSEVTITQVNHSMFQNIGDTVYSISSTSNNLVDVKIKVPIKINLPDYALKDSIRAYVVDKGLSEFKQIECKFETSVFSSSINKLLDPVSIFVGFIIIDVAAGALVGSQQSYYYFSVSDVAITNYKYNLIRLPFYQQTFKTCFSSTTLMLLHSFQPPLLRQDNLGIYQLVSEAGKTKDIGIKTTEQAANILCNKIFVYTGTMPQIEPNTNLITRRLGFGCLEFMNYCMKAIDEGRPIIANMGDHSAMIVGYENPDNSLDKIKLIIHNSACFPYHKMSYKYILDYLYKPNALTYAPTDPYPI